MSCVQPVELADFLRNRVSERRAIAVERHLQACAGCRTAAARIQTAHETMREAADAPVPDVGGIRTEATIRWTRVSPRPLARPMFGFALGLTACAAGLFWWIGRGSSPGDLAPRSPMVTPRIASAQPIPSRLEALVTLVGGHVTLGRDGKTETLLPATLLHGGDTLTTGANARVAAQWGEGSGLMLTGDGALALEELAPGSQRLRLRRGKLDVRVGPHQPGESLQVMAPAHTVTVKGTWFTVAAESSRTTVEVFEGVVEVTERDGSATTLLRAPATAVFERGHASTAALDAQRAAAARSRSELNLLPWAGVAGTRDASGLLSIASDPEGALAVDGVELGPTPLAVRRPLGRHYIEIARRGFQPLRRWVSLGQEPGELRLALVRAIDAPPPPSGPVAVEDMVRERARQIRACYERSLKRDPTLAGTVSLRLRVGDAGQVTQARVEESTLDDPLVGDCLRHEAAGWSFKAGRNATVVYPFVFRPQ